MIAADPPVETASPYHEELKAPPGGQKERGRRLDAAAFSLQASGRAEGLLTWGLDEETLGRFHGYRVCIPVFAGPLDLLLYLVERERMDIHSIRLSLITSQYLEYVALLEALDIEVAAEFVAMAARLLELKSRSLLPSPPPTEGEEEGPDPQAVLAAQLLEYQRFRQAASSLGEIAQQQTGVFSRGDGNGEWDGIVLDQVTTADLFAAFRQILARAQEAPVTRIAGPRFTLRQKMSEILQTISAAEGGGIEFRQLFPAMVTRVEVIITFLALLELVRRMRLTVRQRGVFGEIWICSR